jgi:NAD(P)-dependent dehydrogenase (short-subunit alcohol dehydrogenase family)
MFKEQCLVGRTAIVTGGGTGLGLSMALKFAELGANLVIASRSSDHVDAACDDSGYITGDIMTIDGGAWLAGTSEFNQLAMMAPETVKPLIAAMRGPVGPKQG